MYWKRRIKYISHLGWLFLSLSRRFPTTLVSLVNYGVFRGLGVLFRFNDVPLPSLSWFLRVAGFFCGYSALLTFWDTTNAKYLYSCLRYPVLTAISLFLSSLRPFTFFGISPRKALVLDLGPVLGHSFFLCIYSSHHLSGCRKKIPRCYAVYDALTRY